MKKQSSEKPVNKTKDKTIAERLERSRDHQKPMLKEVQQNKPAKNLTKKEETLSVELEKNPEVTGWTTTNLKTDNLDGISFSDIYKDLGVPPKYTVSNPPPRPRRDCDGQQDHDEKEADRLLQELDEITRKVPSSLKHKTTKKHTYFSKYNFLITTYFNKIQTKQEYIDFLKELQIVTLPNLPSYSNQDPSTASNNLRDFFIDNQKGILSNTYNILLLYLYRFGTPIYSHNNSNTSRVRKLANSLTEILSFTDKEYAALLKQLSDMVPQLFNVILSPYIYSGITKEEFTILSSYIIQHNFTITDDSKHKEIEAISALDFVRDMHSFQMIFNFLLKEVFIEHGQSETFDTHKSLIHFKKTVNHTSEFGMKKTVKGKIPQFLDKIIINDKEYSKQIFEEIVETDFNTFLLNLKFEEDNYEEKIFKEMI